MSKQDSYLTIASPSEGLYKDKGSKFIGMAYPVKDLEEIKSRLQELALLHPKARHICYAYRLGFSTEEARSNDHGEPSGSAGKPILNTILSHQLHYVFIAVIRYFGGTLLGVPGLIHAYKEASIDALAQAEIIEYEPLVEEELHFPYSELNEVMKICKKLPIRILNQKIDNLCTFNLSFTQRNATEVMKALEKISRH
ncbi:YigZ family protein [Aquirufa ecclesiirivi]|uniref:YigZ family protein n=1 Tax=Aquirufa ecclesiirivi TaxID=2715124 RepID=A0ABT4JFJ9_9BACT|nr:YigZ family protein [Aquirufa ecclesiirivi]MCZ2474554.1 YigZ family protein [Aquirufa ecclesiirivi]